MLNELKSYNPKLVNSVKSVIEHYGYSNAEEELVEAVYGVFPVDWEDQDAVSAFMDCAYAVYEKLKPMYVGQNCSFKALLRPTKKEVGKAVLHNVEFYITQKRLTYPIGHREVSKCLNFLKSHVEEVF